MLLSTAYVNEDGTVAVVVMNSTPRGGPYSLVVGSSSLEITSLPHSIQTVVFKAR
jgi:glucosylceramidase